MTQQQGRQNSQHTTGLHDRQKLHATDNVRENRAAAVETDRRTDTTVCTQTGKMADCAEKKSSTVRYYIVRKLRLAD
jgi:DNA gyrase/topoisomerase IV subunit B